MNAILASTEPELSTTQPLSPEREAEIRGARYTHRSLAAADIAVDDLLAEIGRLRVERHSTNGALAELTVSVRASEARTANAKAGA